MPATFSFPMGRVRFMAGPRLWVGLGLALVAALAQLLIHGDGRPGRPRCVGHRGVLKHRATGRSATRSQRHAGRHPSRA